MNRRLKAALVVVGLVVIAGGFGVINEAAARPGGSNFMNSPGYQRRLQESRGYVTNRSTSVVKPPPAYRSQPHRPYDRGRLR